MDITEGVAVTTAGRVLARNTALNLAGQAIPLLVGLAAMPSIARGLGTDRLGLLGMGWAVLGYFGVLDFGVGRAATRFAAHALGRGARSELPAVMRSEERRVGKECRSRWSPYH